MCPWVGPHVPSFGRQLWGLPSRVEYLSPQGVLLPLVYGTTASPLWLELRGHSAWQATSSWTVYRLALSAVASMAPGDVCHGPRCSLAGLGPVALEYRSCHWPGGSAGSPQCVRPMGCWFFPVPRPPYVCAVSWAAWLLFTGVPARFVVLRLRCPGPLGSCSPVCSLGVLCCVCGVLGQLAPVLRCARWVCCVACAVSQATWLLFTCAPARCVASRVRRPGPLGSCSPVCPLRVLFCVCGVLALVAPVHRCARSLCCVACAVSWATWRLFTGVPARCVVLRVRCPGPLGSCSPVCPLGVLFCVRGVLCHLAPVHRCARLVCCFACAVSWASWLLFCGLRVCLLLSPRSLPQPFPCSSLFAGLFCFVFFFLGGVVGVRRFWCCAWVWVCAGAGAGVGVGVVGDGGRVAVALWVPCVCAGPQASGFQGAGPGGADGGRLAPVVAWHLRGWSRLLGSALVACMGAGVRVGVFMAWADGVVGSVGVAGLCGCRVCVRRRRGGSGWGSVGDAMGGGDAGDAYGGGAVGVETGWCC